MDGRCTDCLVYFRERIRPLEGGGPNFGSLNYYFEEDV